MPPTIHLLPDSLMKRIAAGEVIERPASVAKELIENALDAGASSVSLLIEGAGTSLIQIVDDGTGMSEEDAMLCCRRHATSKISSAEDLEKIRSLGFRGEALASISSVSRMTITTRTEDTGEGTRLVLEDGRVQEVGKTAAKRGTSIAVKDLFAVVPARRKFLKTPATELKHILAVFRRMALSRPDVAFSLFIDGAKTMGLAPGDLKRRIADLYDPQKVAALIPVSHESAGIRIEGFVSRPGGGGTVRENQFLFLNRRYILHRGLAHTILSAYGPRLGNGEFPIYILFVEMDPGRYDVNVHPSKLEVRFAEDRLVFDVMRGTVLTAFRTPGASPELKIVSRAGTRQEWAARLRGGEGTEQLTLDAQRPPGNVLTMPYDIPKVEGVFWQLHERYILTQIKSGLAIIDQHVAHERILYEKALASRTGHIGMSQQLLFSQVVQLSIEDAATLKEMHPYLEKIGFGLRDFGAHSILVESVPAELKPGREADLLLEMIQTYLEERGNALDSWDAVAKSFACRAAIKSGDRLTHAQMASLVDQLFATEEPYFCPHGRPIIVNLPLEEIDKRFGR